MKAEIDKRFDDTPVLAPSGRPRAEPPLLNWISMQVEFETMAWQALPLFIHGENFSIDVEKHSAFVNIQAESRLLTEYSDWIEQNAPLATKDEDMGFLR